MAYTTQFETWWQSLAAVPADRTELDWWGTKDGRCDRYTRLARMWGDPTGSKPPEFFLPSKEKHLLTTLWENLTLFHPRHTVPLLYQMTGLGKVDSALDLAWAYDFQLGHQQRHLDLVVHVRLPQHDELLVAEAKAPGCKFAPKDLLADEVLGREQFDPIALNNRRYFLIGDHAPKGWLQGRHGILPWEGLLRLQLKLTGTVEDSESARALLHDLIAVQFFVHGIGDGIGRNDVKELVRRAHGLLPEVRSQLHRSFVTTACEHLVATVGQATNVAPFDYLSEEPGANDIVPGWRPGYGTMKINTQCYWRLPPRDGLGT